MTPTLTVENLSVAYEVTDRGGVWPSQRRVTALHPLSFEIAPGETLGLVGESGSGKTTAGRAILRRVDVAGGCILFQGADITRASGSRLRRLRAEMQLILQDPFTSLNPRMRIADLVGEPLTVHGRAGTRAELRGRVASLLERVGLPADSAERFPHAFSGGQLQRVGIARALALNPRLIVADEPVSALDVSVRAQVVNLMQDIQREEGLSYLFIAHDLAIVRQISHRVAILYAGRLVEIAGREAIYGRPRHPYTVALLDAVPVPDPPAQRLRQRTAPLAAPPDMGAAMQGCAYAARCPRATERCRAEEPPLAEIAPGHKTACWHPV
ncbi:peptide/nickel transport system ATP-binding protein [Palleronia aestuarii]|uniref:Peptide/nickel transport system ATP-binding protein n=1 Tax=Palleronia aestuarii TaxID=568105 RepID=A0A2W7P112_9RHOB|nr:ABC transporter ATP-binding protein [Palleronia aestuarii]PZX17142.1 peptide/nickel transport system ATP-binding protein [Palleronia aestuarii]